MQTGIFFFSSVLSWEDPFKTTYALITYILMVLYMELWALPILPLLLLLFHWFHRQARTKSSELNISILSDQNKDREELIVLTGAGEDEQGVTGEEEENEDEDVDGEGEWNLADRVKMVVKSAHWMQEVD